MSDIIEKIKALILKAGDWLFEVKPVAVKVVTKKKAVSVSYSVKRARPKKK
jgi:hypothetical protein